MQLHIAVCDDDENDQKVLCSHIDSVCADMNIKAFVHTFFTGEELLASSCRSYDIVFMDIYLKGINGIDAARSINRSENCRFVFTSVSSEHAIEAFNLNAAHYLCKPLTKEAVAEAIKRCFPAAAKENKVLEIKSGKYLIPIPMDKIMYIEVTDKLCTIHTEKNSFQTYSSLNALTEFLDEDIFIRAQQSFSVNMNFIDSFFYDHVVMRDGTQIFLSRNSRSMLKDKYQQFLFRLAREGNI